MIPVGRPQVLLARSLVAHQNTHALADIAKHLSFWHSAIFEMSSAVSEPRMPILSSLVPVLKPCMDFSIKNAVMPLEPASGLTVHKPQAHQRQTIGNPHFGAVQI